MKFVRLTRQGVTFFQAEGLGTVHGFSTRLGGISSPPYNTLNLGLNQGDAPACVRENYRRFCAALGADGNRMVCTHQVHGDVIRVATSADAGNHKSESADIYEMAMRRLQSNKRDTVVFEDALHAIRTAKAAGFRVAGVYEATAEQDQPEIQRLCDYYIRSYEELVQSETF